MTATSAIPTSANSPSTGRHHRNAAFRPNLRNESPAPTPTPQGTFAAATHFPPSQTIPPATPYPYPAYGPAFGPPAYGPPAYGPAAFGPPV
ncbi:hypothetical protein GCM10027589_42810 [Actinocorallia lasiicapitis]